MSTNSKEPSSDYEFANAVILRRVRLSEVDIERFREISEDGILIINNSLEGTPHSKLHRYLGKHGGVIYYEKRYYTDLVIAPDSVLTLKVLGRLDLSHPKLEFTIGVPQIWLNFAIFLPCFIVFLFLGYQVELSWRVVLLTAFTIYWSWRYIFTVFWAERNMLELLTEVEKKKRLL